MRIFLYPTGGKEVFVGIYNDELEYNKLEWVGRGVIWPGRFGVRQEYVWLAMFLN